MARLPVCLSVLVSCAAEAHPQDAVTPEFVLMGYRDSCERFMSGAYRARGMMADDDPIAGRLEGKIEIASAFDVAQGLFRFDEMRMVREPTGARDVPAPKAWAAAERRGRFVRTPQRTIRWQPIDRAVAAVGPPTDKPPDFVRPFDIRTGFCTLADFEGSGGPFTGDFQGHHSAVEYMKLLNSWSGKMTARRVDKFLIRLNWPMGKNDEMSITFDERIGCRPVRFESRFIVTPPGQPNPFNIATTTWARINQTYVPEKISAHYYMPGRVTTYDITFEWDHVNRSVPKEIFTVEGMSLPEGLPIVSNETGRAVTLGKVGDKNFPPATIHSAVFGNVPWYSRWWAITAAVVVLATAALGIVWLRRRRGQLPATP